MPSEDQSWALARRSAQASDGLLAQEVQEAQGGQVVREDRDESYSLEVHEEVAQGHVVVEDPKAFGPAFGHEVTHHDPSGVGGQMADDLGSIHAEGGREELEGRMVSGRLV